MICLFRVVVFFLYKMTLLLLSCSANLSSTRILFYHGQPGFTDLFINASFKSLDIFLYLSYQLNKLKKGPSNVLGPFYRAILFI